MTHERRTELGWCAWAILLFAATAAVYFVLPLGRHFGQRLLGTALFAPDPILNAGILEWGYRSLWSPTRHIFEWNAGFPLHDSLAGTENLIGWQLFYSPLRLLCGTVAAYNVAIVVSFVLSGLGATLLAARLGADRWGSLVAGFVFAFVPFHLNHVIHIQTMGVAYCPFVLYFLDRFLAESKLWTASALVLTYVLTALSSLYFGLFLPFVIAFYSILAWTLRWHRFRLRTLGGLILCGAVSVLLLVPILLPYLRFGAAYGYGHPVGMVVQLSLELLAVTKLPLWAGIWQHGPIARRVGWTPAFPGFVASALALAFFALPLRKSEGRRVRTALVILVLTFFVLSLGPVLKIHPYQPIWKLAWLPMPGKIFKVFSAIRWPMRIVLLAFLFAAVGSGLGFSRLTERYSDRARRAAALLILVALFVEYRPRRFYVSKSLPLLPPLKSSEAYPFLAAESDRGAVIELPFFNAEKDPAPYRARYVYGSSGHLRRAVAYHGSTLPTLLDNLQAAADNLPSEESRRFLVASGVTRLVVHREAKFVDLWPQRRDFLLRAGYPVLFDGKGATVFDLKESCARDLGAP